MVITAGQGPRSPDVPGLGEPLWSPPGTKKGRARGAGSLGLGPSPPGMPVGPQQAASPSVPSSLTRDADAHTVCSHPGSDCEALGIRSRRGKPLWAIWAGPRLPPGWVPGQAVSGPTSPLPAPWGCLSRGKRVRTVFAFIKICSCKGNCNGVQW